MTPPPTTPTPRLNMGELSEQTNAEIDRLGEFLSMDWDARRQAFVDADGHVVGMKLALRLAQPTNTRPRTEGRGEDRSYALVRRIGRLTHAADDGFDPLEEDLEGLQDTLNSLIADARDIMASPPIREPEISREAAYKLAHAFITEQSEGEWGEGLIRKDANKLADAILNLAPVGAGNATVPVDATPAMVEAALRVDWLNEDERGTVHNVWHAMVSAAPVGGLGERWRPIETAPPYGVQVLLIGKYPTGNGWSDVYHGWRNAGGSNWDRWPHNFKPTHWQPLPAPPQEQGGMK